MSTTTLFPDWMHVDRGAMDATLDVREKMPHGIFVSVFDEEWLAGDRPSKRSWETLYSTVVGHNVLEVEGLEPKKASAPISVTRLDASGGDLTVDGTACYPGLKQWRRRLTWDKSQFTVEDQMAAPAEKSAVMLFRWHWPVPCR